MTTKDEVYEAARPHEPRHGRPDNPEALITATDSRACLLRAETLGDACARIAGEMAIEIDFDRAYVEYQAGRLTPRRRMSDGRLALSWDDALDREIRDHGGLRVRKTETKAKEDA